MIISMKEYSERVSVEIDGHGRAEQITWPEAARMLDQAYTEEIAATAETIDKYIKAAQAGMVQTMNALDALKELKRNLEERHLKTTNIEREDKEGKR